MYALGEAMPRALAIEVFTLCAKCETCYGSSVNGEVFSFRLIFIPAVLGINAFSFRRWLLTFRGHASQCRCVIARSNDSITFSLEGN